MVCYLRCVPRYVPLTSSRTAHSAASSAQFGEFSGAQKLLNQSDSTEENEGDAKTETSASALQLTCLNCAVDGTVATPKPLWSPGELGRHLMTDFHTSAEYLSRVTNHTEDEEKVPCLSCNRHILTANFLKHIESQHSGHR